MNETIITVIIATVTALTGAISALGGVFLQSALAHKFGKNLSLIEARRVIYAKLLSASMSEDRYPIFGSGEDVRTVDAYNQKMREWRSNRRVIKGLAAEALLVSSTKPVRDRLEGFIRSNDPDDRLVDIELLGSELEL